MYSVLYDRRVLKELKKLSSVDVARLRSAMTSLGDNPLPMGNQKLFGVPGLYRIRQGNFRVLYTVDHPRKLVHVIAVRDRKEAYRGL